MAKNDKAYEAFLADLKAINPAVEEILKDDKVAGKLKEGVLARAEFSSQMDALKAEKEQFSNEVAEAKTKINEWQKWYGDATAEYAAAVNEVKRYREEFGDLENGRKPKGMSQEEFEQRLQSEFKTRETAYLKFMDDLSDLKLEHKDRFKERLDTNEVYKIAGEKNLPLDVAYKVYIADREDALRTADVEERIKKAREEGAQEALRTHNLPTVPSSSAVVHAVDAYKPGSSSKDRVAAAVDGFLSRNK